MGVGTIYWEKGKREKDLAEEEEGGGGKIQDSIFLESESE